MAKKQSILSRILSRATNSHPQFADLLEILRALDLELNLARGVPANGLLVAVCPEDLRSAFLRAHQALKPAAEEAHHG